MDCWKCAKQISEGMGKIAFRAICPLCDIDLHVCKNCRYYAPGKPNECAVPGTESIRDREAANYCEEFKVKVGGIASSQSKEDLKQKFKSLFKGEDSG